MRSCLVLAGTIRGQSVGFLRWDGRLEQIRDGVSLYRASSATFAPNQLPMSAPPIAITSQREAIFRKQFGRNSIPTSIGFGLIGTATPAFGWTRNTSSRVSARWLSWAHPSAVGGGALRRRNFCATVRHIFCTSVIRWRDCHEKYVAFGSVRRRGGAGSGAGRDVPGTCAERAGRSSRRGDRSARRRAAGSDRHSLLARRVAAAKRCHQ